MNTLTFFCSFFLVFSLSAQEIIKLPNPSKTGGKPLKDCLNERHSTRSFQDKALPDQLLSDLLWAADGVNRPESGKRTAPSSMGYQEISIYLTTSKGTFIYDPINHQLLKVNNTDMRAITGKQDFVGTASVNLVFVADYSKTKGKTEGQRMASASNAGFIAQNVYLFCASENLGVVVRGYFDGAEIAKNFNLNENQEVILCQTVGYIKE